MKVNVLSQSGFCGGVTRALYLLDKTIKENPERNIYLIGPIVHNMQVNESYRRKGIVFISMSDIKNLSDHSLVVISAHGLSNKDRKQLERMDIIDTTCPYVQKTKNLIDKNEANPIIFIGKKDHSETKTMTRDNPNILVVDSEDDLNKFSSSSYGMIFNQTTYNIQKLHKLQKLIQQKAPFYEIEDTMCIISKEMQEYLSTKHDEYNVAVIVGDSTSSNSNSLVEMSPYHSTYFIGSSKDVANIKFRSFDSVIIIGSASTSKDELKKVQVAIKAQFSKENT